MLSTFYQEILFIRKSLSTAKCVVENEKHKMIEDNLFYKYLLIQLMTRFSGSQKQRMHFGKQLLTFARNKLFISHPGWLILIKTMCNSFSLLSIDRANVFPEDKLEAGRNGTVWDHSFKFKQIRVD